MIAVLTSLGLSRVSMYSLSGFVFILSAGYLYYQEYKQSGKKVQLRGIFLLSFVGGQGISALKLSFLQKDWDTRTWLCFALAVLSFYYAYEYGMYRHGKALKNAAEEDFALSEKGRKGLSAAVCLLCLISLLAFMIEASLLGYVPLFVYGVPHAYSYFHISGLHYFTVSCVLVPAMGLIYFLSDPRFCLREGEKPSFSLLLGKLRGLRLQLRDCAVLLSVAVALLIPILLVSRFQFMFAVLVAAVTFLALKRNVSLLLLLPAFACILPIYVLLTVARSHDIAYLNGIFEMKGNFPIFISQPYIYVANNYDNFNAMVENLTEHSWGLKMLFPVFAFTGLKFVLADMLSFPLFVTKTELTTLTLIYDAYYDFGIPGIVLLCGLLGYLAFRLENAKVKNPIFYLIYAQILLYFLLSFFTTWFSNPTTWFYLGLSLMIYYGIERYEKRNEGKQG